eukprot:SAG31_NODE_342_length_17455_cov_6.381251_3_plen_93_part_00
MALADASQTVCTHSEQRYVPQGRCRSALISNSCEFPFCQDLEKKEKTCIENCATQFKTGYLQRIMRIFPEELQRMNQENLEKAQAQASGPME